MSDNPRQHEESHEVVVRIDRHEKPMEWRSWGRGSVFEVVVEASNKISLGGGKTSHGFVVTTKHGTSKTGGNTFYVALTEGNPVVATFVIRGKADLVTKDGVLTFADVTLKDEEKLPISFRLEPKIPLANPPAMPTPGAVQDDAAVQLLAVAKLSLAEEVLFEDTFDSDLSPNGPLSV